MSLGRRTRPRRKVHPIQPDATTAPVEVESDEWRNLVATRAAGRCELGIHPRCPGYGEHAHHRLRRRHPGANHPDNGRFLCAPCHDLIHFQQVDWARRHLWLLSPGVPFAAPVDCPLSCEEDHR